MKQTNNCKKKLQYDLNDNGPQKPTFNFNILKANMSFLKIDPKIGNIIKL